MQHLGAEIGQLGGFGERDQLDPVAARRDARVRSQHAVYIGPDLNLVGSDARAHDGRREIRAAPAKRGCDARLGRADETAHDDYGGGGQRLHDFLEPPVSLRIVRRGLRVPRVGQDHLPRVYVHGFHAEAAEGQGHDGA